MEGSSLDESLTNSHGLSNSCIPPVQGARKNPGDRAALKNQQQESLLDKHRDSLEDMKRGQIGTGEYEADIGSELLGTIFRFNRKIFVVSR